MAVLEAHQVRQMEGRLKAGKHYKDRDMVFPDAIGRPENPMALTRAHQSLAKKAGVPRGRLHDLRHFHPSLLFYQGASPVLVRQRLGHGTLLTSADLDEHIADGAQRDMPERFAARVRNAI